MTAPGYERGRLAGSTSNAMSPVSCSRYRGRRPAATTHALSHNVRISRRLVRYEIRKGLISNGSPLTPVRNAVQHAGEGDYPCWRELRAARDLLNSQRTTISDVFRHWHGQDGREAALHSRERHRSLPFFAWQSRCSNPLTVDHGAQKSSNKAQTFAYFAVQGAGILRFVSFGLAIWPFLN